MFVNIAQDNILSVAIASIKPVEYISEKYLSPYFDFRVTTHKCEWSGLA